MSRDDTERVQLRPATAADRRPIYEALAKSDVTDFLLGDISQRHTRLLSYAEFCADYKQHYFDDSQPEAGRCFVIEVAGRAIGQVNYNEIDRARGRVELDIWMFAERYCGRGHGTAALRLMCEFLEARLGVQNFVIRPTARNPRAIRAYEKAGFERVDLSPADAACEYGPPDDVDGVTMCRFG